MHSSNLVMGVATAALLLCLLGSMPTGANATNTTNTTCVPSLACGACVGGGSCGYCKANSMCMEGTAGGSFINGCSGANWTWFAEECPATGPVITVITEELLSLPVNAKLSVSIVDPQQTTSDVAVWYCIALSQGSNETCPYNILSAIAANTATTRSLLIAGPIPAGKYRFYLTYKAVRSTNMTLTVMCNATDMVDGRCPGNCPYTCPDTTCATSLATCNCTQFATINDAAVSVWPVNADPAKVNPAEQLTFTASASYRQNVGSCSSFDFAPYMKLQWKYIIGSGSEQSFASTIPSNRSTLQLPAKFFTPGTTYTVVTRFFTADGTAAVLKSSTFVATAPTPFVSLTTRGSKLVVGPTNIILTAVITDLYPTGVVATYNCAGTCGTALLAALSANGTNAGAFIAGPVAAGTSTLTITYKGVTSAPLTLVVMSTAVPRIQIATSAVPVIANTFLASQTIIFVSTVTFSEETNLQWSVNGVNYSTAATFSVPASAMVQSLTQLNNISLRASSKTNAAVYGESTYSLYLAPTQAVAISAINNVNNNSNPLLALSDTAEVVFAAQSPLSGAAVSYEVGYLSGSLKLRQVRTAATTASFVTPIPADGLILQVYVSLLLNDMLAATAYMNYSVRMPSGEAAFANQLAALESTDPLVKAQAAANLGALLQRGSSTNATTNAAATTQVMNALVGLASADGVPPGLIFGTLNAALKSSSNTSALATQTKEIANGMATKITAADAGSFLSAVTTVPADAETNEILNKAGKKLANDLAVGASFTVSSNGQTISGKKVVASDLASSSAAVGSSQAQLAPIPGIDSTTAVSVSGTEATTNGYAKRNGNDPSTPVVSFTIQVNGSDFTVANLTTPIVIVMNSANPQNDQCLFLDTTTNAWSSYGLTKTGYTATTISCATTHLTTFAGFASAGSSAGRVVASLLVVAVAALLQIAARF